MSDERVVDPGVDDEQFDRTLRPRALDDYVGQQQVRENLGILLEAARRRGEPVEHVLLCGPPGLGKTTLANIIANEIGVAIKTTSGPAIDHAGALASMLLNQQDRDVFFIDEIHRLNKLVEESLYPALEDFRFDFVSGKGAGATPLRLTLPRFTCVGATTRQGLLSGPMRDRFGAVYRLDFYTEAALAMLEVDGLGLEPLDRRILETMILKFRGGPVGLDTIATSVAEEPETIEDVHEPFLIQTGLLARTPRGRVATELAYRHLGIALPPAGPVQQPLL
jgi:Holliday junction DNA helicase RuvB